MTNTPLFSLGFEFASAVDAGQVRKSNQDRVVCCPESGFFAVIDGMGGLADGEKAADLIKDILPAMIVRLSETLPKEFTVELAGSALAKAIGGVSDSIFERTNENGRIAYGAALCAVWLVDHCAVIVHLGDSRAYWLGNGANEAVRLTRDHNVAAEMVAAGLLKPEEASRHSASARLTRFAGMRAPSAPEISYKRIGEGDCLLLCSDGLYGETKAEELSAGMRESLPAQERCDGLAALANRHGGRDNISLILISF